VDPHQSFLAPPITPNPTASTTNTASGFRSHFSYPFDIFKTSGGSGISGHGGDISKSVSFLHSQFVRGVFSRSKTDVALFVDQSTLDLTSVLDGVGVLHQHVFLPFFGGPDDRLALDFVVQICANSRLRGTVVRLTKWDGASSVGTEEAAGITGEGLDPKISDDLNRLTADSRIDALPDTVYGQQSGETRMQSDTADNIVWAQYASSTSGPKVSSSSAYSEPRVEFRHLHTSTPLRSALQEATAVSPGRKVVVVTGRSRRLAVENHRAELKALMDEHGHLGAEVRKTVGDVATAFMVAGVGSGVVVVQAMVAL
jgi:hypothetical protein